MCPADRAHITVSSGPGRLQSLQSAVVSGAPTWRLRLRLSGWVSVHRCEVRVERRSGQGRSNCHESQADGVRPFGMGFDASAVRHVYENIADGYAGRFGDDLEHNLRDTRCSKTRSTCSRRPRWSSTLAVARGRSRRSLRSAVSGRLESISLPRCCCRSLSPRRAVRRPARDGRARPI